MNYESHQDNLFEVIELEKADNVEVRIGPEVHVGSVDEIKINSSFICIKCKRKVRTQSRIHDYLCLLLEFYMVDNIKSDEFFFWIFDGHILFLLFICIL